MYLPSENSILGTQRADAALRGADSAACVAATRRRAVAGRVAMFNTLISPESAAEQFGIGTAVNVAKLQQQTEDSRASGLLGMGLAVNGSPDADLSRAPEVVSLNRGGGCQSTIYTPVPLGPDPAPAMPQRAPVIRQSSQGPLYYRGAATEGGGGGSGPLTSTPEFSTRYMEIRQAGMTGYAPSWADAGLVEQAVASGSGAAGSWLMENRWLVLALAGLGVMAASQRGKR